MKQQEQLGLPVPVSHMIQSRILTLRGHRVMLSADLAVLYGVPARRLNEQVRRNLDRFPADFMFQLSEKEHAVLKSQFATSSWGGAGQRRDNAGLCPAQAHPCGQR